MGQLEKCSFRQQSIFFKKIKTSVFSPLDDFFRIKQPQKIVDIFFQSFTKLYEKHFFVHLMHGIVR